MLATRRLYSVVVFAGLAAMVCAGCGDSKNGADGPDPKGEHGHEGPHGGHLIEIGDHEYHGEAVHDEAKGTVTIYILDKTAKKAHPIEAKEVVINIAHAGKAEQFKLAASPDAGDPEGKSSRFVSNDKHLHDDLHEKNAKARLVVSIGGKSYTAEIHHDDE